MKKFICFFSALLSLLFTSCTEFNAGMDLGISTPYYQNRLIKASTPDGKKRLDQEQRVDPILKMYISNNGSPDYIFVVDAYKLFFIYTNPEKLTTFNRSRYTMRSEITESQEIPSPWKTAITPKPIQNKDPEQAAPQPLVKVCYGSGCAFTPTRIITAYHVVSSAAKIQVRFDKEDWTTARILNVDPQSDLAVLEIQSARSNYFPLTENKKAPTQPGDRIFSLGYPMSSLLGDAVKYTEGVVSSTSGLRGNPRELQTTLPIQPGSSGAPLIREDGCWVGIITASVDPVVFAQQAGALPQSVNFATATEWIVELTNQVPTTPEKLSRKDLLKRVGASVCRIRSFSVD